MPTPEQILLSLIQIANQWQGLAIVWHVYFAVLAIGLALGIRPSKRIGGVLFGLPLLSVSVLAWMAANPFNGILFALAGVTQIILALRLPAEPIEIAPMWIVGAGVFMFFFGWVYPHFLATSSWMPYLYAAPTGLVPCPTLSIVIGLSLMVSGFNSRAWLLVVSAMGIFYGIFGTMRLGVTLDWILLLGALFTILVVFWPKSEMREPALMH